MKLKVLGFLILMASMTVSACSNLGDTSDLKEEILEKIISEQESPAIPQPIGPRSNALHTSVDVMDYIKEKDMAALSLYVHPDKGLRFTPYTTVDLENDQVFAANQVANLLQDPVAYHWGQYDGSGESINLTFKDYYEDFIYDEDFLNPDLVGNNLPFASGNSLDNINEAYPQGHFIEFYFNGIDPQYSGIDWRSLRLVFEEKDGLWYLVGIIHGEWTI